MRILGGKSYYYSHFLHLGKLRHTYTWPYNLWNLNCPAPETSSERQVQWLVWKVVLLFLPTTPEWKISSPSPHLLTPVSDHPTSTELCLLGQARGSIWMDDLYEQLPLPWPSNWKQKGGQLHKLNADLYSWRSQLFLDPQRGHWGSPGEKHKLCPMCSSSSHNPPSAQLGGESRVTDWFGVAVHVPPRGDPVFKHQPKMKLNKTHKQEENL